MRTPLHLTLALLLAAGTVAAQSPSPGKLKVKMKPGRAEISSVVAPVAPAAPTDWSLPYAATITPDGLKADLTVLASDAYEGRETGKKGQKMAADYIAKAFAAYGLTGPVQKSDNAHLQHFDMNRGSLNAAASTAKVGSKTYQGTKDFYAFSTDDTFAAPTAVQPVFIGYAIKEDKYSDFAAAADYTGKDVVMLLGEPTNAKGQALLGADGKPSPYGGPGMAGLMARQSVIFPMKARSVTIILPTAEAFAKVPAHFGDAINQEQLTFVGGKKRPGFNIILVSPELGAKLLGTTPAGLSNYRKAVATAGKAVPSPFKPATATVQLAVKNEVFTTENVLGYLEGSDKKDEVLVVSAHYDHLGMMGRRTYFPGANDNASGVALLLELAAHYARPENRPAFSVVFLLFGAEEAGLVGSRYFVAHPLVPLKSIKFMVNLDLLGTGEEGATIVNGRVFEAPYRRLLALNNAHHYLPALGARGRAANSDHFPFSEAGVPAFFMYTRGGSPAYHDVNDKPAALSLAGFAGAFGLVRDFLGELGAAPTAKK